MNVSQLETNTATLQSILSAVNALPDAGTGGEDVSEETAEYTSLLTDLETAIDALPDAGSGGGSSVETCTVTIRDANSDVPVMGLCMYYYQTQTGWEATAGISADQMSIQCVAPSLFVIVGPGIPEVANNAEVVVRRATTSVVYIMGNATLLLSE